MVAVSLACEGPTDVPVAQRLLELSGLELGPVFAKGGKNGLDAKLPGYNQAARLAPWLVLRDLDVDAECAPTLRQRLLPAPEAGMRLRIPVHATEAWLLADREAISRFLAVAVARIPLAPDDLPNPKAALIEVAGHSRRRAVRQDMVPPPGSTARVGPGYTARVMEFATDHWRPEVAARTSASLRKCIECLRAWRP